MTRPPISTMLLLVVLIIAAGVYLHFGARFCRAGDLPGPTLGGVFRIEGC